MPRQRAIVVLHLARHPCPSLPEPARACECGAGASGSAEFWRRRAKALGGPIALKRGIAQQRLPHLERLAVTEFGTELKARGSKH
jgi:hypothetical protein